MALTKISTDGVKDDAITKTKIPANQIEASELADNAVDTAAIADQAVALSKLPHGDGSNDGKFLRANNGADPSFETITGTTINNNADNRVITGSGTANTLNGESGLTYAGSRLTQSSGDTIIDQSNNGYGGLRILDSTAGEYSVNYILGRNSGLSAHVFKYNGRTQNQSPWNDNGTGNEMGRWTAAGIAFNGDTAAANSLNDYEEGTWSAVVNSGSATIQNATYTKIGNLVRVCLYATAFSDTTSSNQIQFNNLPFASSSNQIATGALMTAYLTTQSRGAVAYIGNNNSHIRLFTFANNGNYTPVYHSAILDSNTTRRIFLSITYTT